MNKLAKKIDSAKSKWEKLNDNKEPIVYIGAAGCGRAAGALELNEGVKAFLDENKKTARIIEVGCIGPCYLEPLVDIKMPGHPRVSYNNVNAKRPGMILKSHLSTGCPIRNSPSVTSMFLLVGATILGLGAAVGTATGVLSLVLRFMSKLR